MTDTQREAFEKWMINEAKIIIGSKDPYPAGLEQQYWKVWQAALSHSQPDLEKLNRYIPSDHAPSLMVLANHRNTGTYFKKHDVEILLGLASPITNRKDE